MPVLVAVGQWILLENRGPYWILAGIAAWLGVVFASYFFSREVCPKLTARSWLHQVVVGWSIAVLWWGIVVAIAVAMPAWLDWRGGVLLTIFFAACMVWAFGGFVWFGKKARMFMPAPERLRSIVQEVSARMRVTVRGVWVAQGVGARAYIIPYTRDVFFSATVAAYPDTEIAAICAHELGHCCEPRRVRIARLASCVALVPWLLIKPWFHYSGVASIFMALGAFWIIRLWSQDLSRHMEVHADRQGRENEADLGVYARALEHVYQDNLAPAVMPEKHSHPHLYDRLLSVGFTPSYGRPEPPDSRTMYNRLLWALLILLGIMVLMKLQ
ncbi:MAG TPA: M48 family metalloprotease [Candidatus Dormibacteraeota bacterium]|nr:M48 family metalloprotease [Candidatus Dormibacteraeota bacterium]